MLRSTSTLLFLLLSCSGLVAQARVQDLIEVQGVQTNQLSGIGLVVGLNNTATIPASIGSQTHTSFLAGNR